MEIPFLSQVTYNVPVHVLLIVSSCLLPILLMWWKSKKSSTSLRSGPRQYFLGGYLNILELKDMSSVLPVFLKWSREYGSIFRVNFGPVPLTVLNSPETIQKLYGSNDTNYFRKSNFVYDVVRPIFIDGILLSTGEKFKQRRKLLNHASAFKSLPRNIETVNAESRQLVSRLDKQFHQDNKPKEIFVNFARATLSLMIKTVCGRDANDKDAAKEEEKFHQLSDRFQTICTTRLLNPWLLLGPIWKLHPLSREHDDIVRQSHDYLNKWILKGRQQILDPSSENNNSEDGYGTVIEEMIRSGISDEGILEEIATICGAGYESTARAMDFLCFLLALNPDHQDLCRQEVDDTFGNPEDCPDENLTLKGVQNLKHLERCILETLRIFPIFPFTLRKIDAPLQIDQDTVLPAHSNVVVCPLIIHMNPEYYPNPEKFDPDRFLPEVRQARHQYAFMTFSNGPRKCPGNKFAVLEILILAARILRHFVITTESKWEDLVILPKFSVTPETPLRFVLHKRNDVPYDDYAEIDI